MRIPLLFGASPRSIKKTPVIPIDSGRWKVLVENLVDSRLSIHHGPSSGYHSMIPLRNNIVIIIHKPSVIYVKIVEPGYEKFISIYLEKVA